MIASSNFLMLLVLPALLGIVALATPVPNRHDQETTIVSALYQHLCRPLHYDYNLPGLLSINTAHDMDVHYSFVNAVSGRPSGSPVLYTFQGAVFKGWRTQQPSTVPLFQLSASSNHDFVFMIGADAESPPVVSGFTAGNILAWVYDTPVCDSVPLMSAVLAGQTDHYWTTDPNEHAGLVASGWADAGIVAYVLPLQ